MWPKPTLPRPQRNELQPRVGCNRTWSAPVNRHPANHEPSQSCLVAISPEKPAGEISGLRFRSVVSNQYQDTQCSSAPLSGSKHRAAPGSASGDVPGNPLLCGCGLQLLAVQALVKASSGNTFRAAAS